MRRIVKVSQVQSLFVLERAMDRQVTQPTKEQVRAYMASRGHAHRPPPPPEEVRRLLNWHLAPAEPAGALFGLFMFPATFGACAARLAFVWGLAPYKAIAGKNYNSSH
jgi:hypothetical protein